jgi:hypothetical protein
VVATPNRDGSVGGMAGVMDRLTRILDRLSRPVGQIQAHLDSLQNLPPEFSRVDMIRFQGLIAAGASPAVTQPANERIPSDMDAELWGIQGYAQDADTEDEDFALVTVKLKEQGRGHDLFTSEFSMAQFVGRDGKFPVIEFPRGIYVIQAGKTISCQFTVSAPTWSVAYNTTAAKLYGVALWFNLRRPERQL